MAVGDEVSERRDAHEPPVHLPGVCLDGEIYVKTLVVSAHGHATGVDAEPALGAADASEAEMDDRAGRRQPVWVRCLVHPPDERQAVAVVLGRLGEHPFGCPVADAPHDGRERLAGGRQLVTAGTTRRVGLATYEPSLFQRAQPLGKQCSAHAWDAAVDLVEAGRPDRELTNDEWCPSIAEYVDTGRDRAVVGVTLHRIIFTCLRRRR